MRIKRNSPKMAQVQTRLPDAELRALQKYQKQHGLTESEAARELLKKAITMLGVD